jgi:hypothetical protein
MSDDQGRPVAPHRSGGWHWVGPTREEAPSMSELIANVTANFYHTDHPLRHWDRTCPACQHAPADGLPERYIQNGRAMISAFCPETGIPKGDWIRAADYDALRARLQEAESRAAALQKELIKVRGHTGYTAGASRDILAGLLASIERIVDAALSKESK